MKAYITSALNSGLGDNYSGIYKVYTTQEYLKKLGYEVYHHIDFGLNPYKMDVPNRDIFFRLFKLNLLDNLKIHIYDGFEPELGNFSESENNTILIFNNDRIYRVYVDEILSEPYDFENFMNWQERDDLPKLNFFTEEVM